MSNKEALAVVVNYMGFPAAIGLFVLNQSRMSRFTGAAILVFLAAIAFWWFHQKTALVKRISTAIAGSKKLPVLDDVQRGLVNLFLIIAVCGVVGWYIHLQLDRHENLFIAVMCVVFLVGVVGLGVKAATSKAGVFLTASLVFSSAIIAVGFHFLFGHMFDNSMGMLFMMNYALLFVAGLISIFMLEDEVKNIRF